MDHNHPADSIGRIAVHASSYLGTGKIEIESSGIKRRGYIFDPLDRLFHILDNLIISRNKDDLSWSKDGGANSISNPIDIDDFSI